MLLVAMSLIAFCSCKGGDVGEAGTTPTAQEVRRDPRSVREVVADVARGKLKRGDPVWVTGRTCDHLSVSEPASFEATLCDEGLEVTRGERPTLRCAGTGKAPPLGAPLVATGTVLGRTGSVVQIGECVYKFDLPAAKRYRKRDLDAMLDPFGRHALYGRRVMVAGESGEVREIEGGGWELDIWDADPGVLHGNVRCRASSGGKPPSVAKDVVVEGVLKKGEYMAEFWLDDCVIVP